MKSFINFLELIIGSIIIWFIVVFATQGNIFKQEEVIPTENEITQNTKFRDGTYEGVGKGFNGDIILEVTLVNNTITDIVITDHSETEGLSDEVIAGMPQLIIEANSHDIDSMTGATATANAIKKAVHNALIKAIIPEEDVELTEDTKYVDGKHIGVARGFGGDLVLEVTILDNLITEIEIISHNETDGLSDEVIAGMPQLIIDANSHDVDSMTGATATANAIKKAVYYALVKAAIVD